MEHNGKRGKNRTVEQGKGGDGASGAGSRERRAPLVGDVQEYCGFYEGEGANTIWIL